MTRGQEPRGTSRGNMRAEFGGSKSRSSGRINKRTTIRGRSSRTSRRTTTQKPYTPDKYSPNESMVFGSVQLWEVQGFTLAQGIKRLEFTDAFNITNIHLDAIVAAGDVLCQSLLDFRAGDAETGKGAGVTDEGVVRFARACPNLVHISFDGGIHLSDESLWALFISCPNLRYIQFSGNDKVAGKLKGTALDTLRRRPDVGKNLVKLRLTDQAEFEAKFTAAVKALSAARKSLAIQIGNTHERHGGICTWLGGKEIHGYQAFDSPGGFDAYGGFGGPF